MEITNMLNMADSQGRTDEIVVRLEKEVHRIGKMFKPFPQIIQQCIINSKSIVKNQPSSKTLKLNTGWIRFIIFLRS